MTQQRATIEIIAPTINDAIEKGLVELELPREAVEIEILDEGNRGLFGLGAHQARVRLIVKQNATDGFDSTTTSTSRDIAFELETEEEPDQTGTDSSPANN
jgi:spoIIIJ-associated protein